MDRKKKFMMGLTITGILTIGGLVNPITLENTRIEAASNADTSGSIPKQEKEILRYLSNSMLDYYQEEKQTVKTEIESLILVEEVTKKSHLFKITEQRYEALQVYKEEKKKNATKAKQTYNKKLSNIDTEQTNIEKNFEKKIAQLNDSQSKQVASIGKSMEYNISSMQKEESKRIEMNAGTDEIMNNINLINKAVKFKKQAIQLNFDNDIKGKEIEIKILGLTTSLEKDKWNSQYKRGSISKTVLKNKISNLELKEKTEKNRLNSVISTMEKAKNIQLQSLFEQKEQTVKELDKLIK
ncbi:hypothetical protein [Niallia sp. Man26]|uniref:hypothetical protein n=1 Tax=Niallia sp. Man26 TaxID=2912824 RepID=UPI001EDA7A0C|nr:hypothetical protein [Niallia sp. Man26]UPO91061.1 hypothetical protein L8T27_026235 [Niallia sp. Man26]